MINAASLYTDFTSLFVGEENIIMVHVKSALVLFVLCLANEVLARRGDCVGGRCVCSRSNRIVRCQDISVNSLPLKYMESSVRGQVEVLNLKRNWIRRVNATAISNYLPHVRQIDLRSQKHQDCVELTAYLN